jgi:galactofuranosylgalactofuranosylrhamnosyl-N-acetylglucosaminyl-diphospho-decaprenol beta-1,5/1,6-galactofuranosyltransferase
VTVNRVVFPVEGVAEVSALYVDTGTGDGSQPGESYEVRNRRSITIYPHRRVSLGTYFNSFPASYWQRWTSVRQIRVSVEFLGSGLVSIYKSTARGRSTAVASHSFNDETVTFDLPLKSFVDGGYYWIDVACGQQEATLVSAEWSVAAPDGWEPGTVTVGITTFNRPTYCLDQIRAVGSNPDVAEVLDRLVVVDQGDVLVQEQPGFDEAAEVLAERLEVIRQPNLGGSGGFSRAMREAIREDKSTYVLLLDDDAISEPEAIVRAVRFADFGLRPTIVGGGMLHLDERSVLYTQGELWDRRRSWMHAAGASKYDHDYADDTLRETPELHRRLDADFNGWWMCLIPTAVVREVGLALPVFLKFDDIEFSLRAGDHGYPTVCLPGVAVWHMAWHDKDPTRTWEEYFIHRNRWITGLLHPGGKRGGLLPLHSFLGDMKLLFMLQYSAVELRHQAVRDLLRGPDALGEMLPVKQRQLRELRSRFIDAQVVEDLTTLPPVRRSSRPLIGPVGRPTNPLFALMLAIRVGVRQLLIPEARGSRENPERIIPAQDIAWWRFADIDSALVTAPDGGGVAWYQRRQKMMVSMLFRSVRTYLRLARDWPKLSRRYAERLPDITSIEAWDEIFRHGGTGESGQ